MREVVKIVHSYVIGIVLGIIKHGFCFLAWCSIALLRKASPTTKRHKKCALHVSIIKKIVMK